MFQTKTPAAAVLTVMLATAAGTVLAAPLGGHPRATERVNERLERMTEQLDLSAAQQEEIRALLDAHHQAADGARAELRERVDAVLTAEQRQQRDAQRQARIERRLERLADRLALSNSQREEVVEIFAQKRADPDMTPAQLHDALAAVLTDDQRSRLESLRERHGPGRHGGGRFEALR
ncbi:MAG: hypothetical protein PVJ30_05795 [Thiohalocapsa sp.]|jgi:hypothetical protein